MADFSFSKMFKHLDAGTSPARLPSSPTEEHMRIVMEKYVSSICNDFSSFADENIAVGLTGEDPVGAGCEYRADSRTSFAEAIERLLDVPFTPKKAELTAPVSVTLENKAAMSFKLWAEVDNKNITIDIIDVMTFDAAGKICDIRAYWGIENVTLLD